MIESGKQKEIKNAVRIEKVSDVVQSNRTKSLIKKICDVLLSPYIFIMADDDVWNIETCSENWKALVCFEDNCNICANKAVW